MKKTTNIGIFIVRFITDIVLFDNALVVGKYRTLQQDS